MSTAPHARCSSTNLTSQQMFRIYSVVYKLPAGRVLMIATLQVIVLTSMRHTDRRTDELQMDNSKSDVSRRLQLRHK